MDRLHKIYYLNIFKITKPVEMKNGTEIYGVNNIMKENYYG